MRIILFFFFFEKGHRAHNSSLYFELNLCFLEYRRMSLSTKDEPIIRLLGYKFIIVK